jgi:acetyl-CoA C-acetyltransferase
MTRRVAIVGVGFTPARPVTPDQSYREMITDAAERAYDDAGIRPSEVDSFVCCEEDFYEGVSISDEYTPDQLGAAQRPVHTVGGDGIHALADAYMEILTGLVDLVVVESHSKASNILTLDRITHYGFDPFYQRPFGLHPDFAAGLEMARFLHETGNTEEQCARVVVKNRRQALRNPSGAHAGAVAVEDVLASAPVAEPLREAEVAPTSDAAYVLVLASGERARRLRGGPVWIRGIGWSNDTPALESRDWGRAEYAELAAERAYRQAGVRDPSREIDLFEVDDTYAYKELQHLEALRVFGKGKAGAAIGSRPVNVSGGSLGMGHLLDASGLARVTEVALQLRGHAGPRQVERARAGLAMGWRGVPTTSGAVAILSAR